MTNFRDLGDAGIRKGLLFRGGELSGLTDEERDHLFGELGIRTVVDLRTAEEYKQNPDVAVAEVKIINIPLLGLEDMTELIQRMFPDVAVCYRSAVRPAKKDAWIQIFDTCIHNEGGILFHCTQGKDRTGIVSAILLSALGVDREAVFEDYLRTNEDASLPEEAQAVLHTLPQSIRKVFQGLFMADQDFLAGTFEEIDQLYGSMDGFLKECCGLDEEKLALLKEKYALN